LWTIVALSEGYGNKDQHHIIDWSMLLWRNFTFVFLPPHYGEGRKGDHSAILWSMCPFVCLCCAPNRHSAF